MPTIISTNSRTETALNFINNVSSVTGNYLYHFYSQQTPWPNEPNPPIPDESIRTYKAVWDNMLGGQLVTLNNMTTVIPKNSWVANTVYTAYTDTNASLFTANPNNFYVINANREVFKCLANNNGGISTVTPSGIGNGANNYVQALSDGYQWKYMFNVANGDQFLNSQWIPVYPIPLINSTQATIAAAAVPGSIDIINILNGGVNYANSPQSYIVNIVGDGTGANAYANVSNNSVQNIIMVNKGTGYSYANVVFTDPNGSGAVAQIIMPPPGGHGANAVFELGAAAVMASIFTYGDMQGYVSSNVAFRQTGLVLNPLKYGSNTVSSNSLVKTYTTLNLTGGVGTYSNNEVVFQGTSINNSTFSGTIIDFDPVFGILRLNNTKGSPQLSNILYGVNSGAQRYVTNIITPDLQNYSGRMLVLENGAPIQRGSSQFEQVQYVIQF